MTDLLPGADAAVDLADDSSTQHLKEDHSSSRVQNLQQETGRLKTDAGHTHLFPFFTCSTVARSDLSFTRYLRRRSSQQVSDRCGRGGGERRPHLHVGVLLLLHAAHSVGDGVGVIQPV